VTKARFDAVWTFGALDFGYGSGSWKGFEGGGFEGGRFQEIEKMRKEKSKIFKLPKMRGYLRKKQPSLVDLVEIHGQKMM
jgi:hypothetical protein